MLEIKAKRKDLPFMFDIIHEKSAANNEVSVRVPKHNNFFIDIRSCNFGGFIGQERTHQVEITGQI